MTRLLLVRHGRTEWNEIGRVQGQIDTALDATGRAQAEKVAARLADHEFAAVYASDLKRAHDTAVAIVTHHPELKIRKDERLREIHLGDWQGLLWNEVEETYADMVAAWRRDVSVVRVPNAETVMEMRDRLQAFLDEIVDAHPDDDVLIVAHGGAIRMLVTIVMEMPLHMCWRLGTGNTSISELFIFPEGPFLQRLNDTRHLGE